MKKLLALALILTLALSVSVFAADRVYGPGAGTTTAPDGSGAGATKVSITATANDVEHRYAIDIQYTNMQVSVTATGMYWDVETFEYKMKDDPGSSVAPANTVATITVMNRSDLSIWYSFSIEDKMLVGEDNDGISFTPSKAADTRYEVTRAIAKEGAVAGHTTDDSFTVTSVPDTDWNDVANFYASYFSANPAASPKEIAAISVSFYGSAS